MGKIVKIANNLRTPRRATRYQPTKEEMETFLSTAARPSYLNNTTYDDT